MNHESQSEQTRERLLAEAERLFAERGYHAVSVRHIVGAAGVHLSAVNYHFGGKKNLYLEVFRQRWLPRARLLQAPILDMKEDQSHTPRQVLEAIARNLLIRPDLDEAEMSLHHRLLAMEFTRPGEAMGLVMEQSFQPFGEKVKKLLQKSLPYAVDEERLSLIAISIISQIVHFHRARPMVSLLTKREYTPQFREEIVRHITDFSLQGLSGMGGQTCA